MNWFVYLLFGGVVGLDATSFPQAMISRPLVAATLAGLLLGDAEAGLHTGLVLELFSLLVLPFGAARYPETGTAAAAAGGALAFSGTTEYGLPALLLAVVFGLAWEQVTGMTVLLARRVNERLVAGNEAHVTLEVDQLERRHLLAIWFDFSRAAVIVVAGTVLGSLLLTALTPWIGLHDLLIAGVLLAAGCAMLGATLPIFGKLRDNGIPLALGLVCGLLLMLLMLLR